MTFMQAMILGVLQGVSELFPVSSLAQSILLRALLKWDFGSRDSDFLAFLVALHLATAVALLIYFRADWKKVIIGFFEGLRRGKPMYDEAGKFAWLLIAGTVIVGFLGLAFEKKLSQLFDDSSKAWIVAAILIVNGCGMMLIDLLKRRAEGKGNPEAASSDPALAPPAEKRAAESLTLIEAASIGATQAFALLPGISRSGATIASGLLVGLSYEQATRFSFMLATPVIGLAALLKVPRLLTHAARPMLMQNILASLLAGVCAYLSTKFLMRYFRHNRLWPFGVYCVAFGIFSILVLKA
jgi:undecaprenyl-diphosphatase